MNVVTVEERDMGLNAIVSNLKAYARSVVDVGTFEPEQAMKAYKNEYGEPNVPMRPAFQTMLKRRATQLVSFLKKSPLFLTNTVETLDDIGVALRHHLENEIMGWRSPPNAPATVAKKGFNDPLMETGDLWASITSQVRPAGTESP